MRDAQNAGMNKPSEEQAKVESLFPAVAKDVRGYGYVEIGALWPPSLVRRDIADTILGMN
jgi:hypothetical protein